MINLNLIISILIIFSLIILLYFWRKLFLFQKELKKETEEAKATLESGFDKLVKELEKEIEFLDGQAGLNPEEKELKERLIKILENSKEDIKKEIEDVEKKIQ